MVRRGPHTGIQKTRKHNGQAMVELASMLPLLALILIGCLDLGRAFHVHMAAANAAHVGLTYAQQVTDPTDPTNAPITVAEVITQTVTAAQGSIPITLATANSYVQVYVNGASVPLTTTLGYSQTVTVMVTDPSFKTITPFVRLTTVGGSATGLTLP